MAAIRTLQPLARAASRNTFLRTAPRRFLSSDAPILYTAHATVRGARTGHIEGDDLNVDLTMAKALGGTGDKGKTNPEELFAAGYSACFQSAMNASAAKQGIKMPTKVEDSVVKAKVHLIGDMKALDMGLKVELDVRVKGLSEEDLQKVIKMAKEVCPYSRATKGNVTTDVKVSNID